MPRLNTLPVLIREWLGPQRVHRVPEPTMTMDEPEQVAAYTVAGRIDGVMAAAYLYHSARISQVIAGCAQVVDLACGPATQLGQVAQLNPGISFLGVDLSGEMLIKARARIAELRLSNVTFQQDDISQLTSLPDQSADAVISTMALHHLPTEQHLDNTLRHVARILRPGGAVYLADFTLLKSAWSIHFFSHMNAAHQPALFTQDYEYSLQAAFPRDVLQACARRHLPADVTVHTTFGIPILCLIKTPDRSLAAPVQEKVHVLAQQLLPRYRADLDEIRLFFKWGGVGNDPFA